MWPLDPETFYDRDQDPGKSRCEMATGSTWSKYKRDMEQSSALALALERTRQLAGYYVACIRLFAAVCKDRNSHGISIVRSTAYVFVACVVFRVDVCLPFCLLLLLLSLNAHVLYSSRSRNSFPTKW